MTYRKYWLNWLLLLLVTGAMLFAGGGSSTAGVGVLALLLAAMTVKAGLIAGNFMHLRSERASLILIVVLGLAATGIALFAGIAVDALRVLRLSGGGS
jgi:cytochrome c oxidase subunit IV